MPLGVMLFGGWTTGGVYTPCIKSLACRVRVVIGDLVLCCCVCVTSFKR